MLDVSLEDLAKLKKDEGKGAGKGGKSKKGGKGGRGAGGAGKKEKKPAAPKAGARSPMLFP
jgi:hypothetical protein